MTLWSAADGQTAGDTFNIPLSIEQGVSACNQASRNLWWNFRHEEDETVIRAHAHYAAANLASGLKAATEWSNEIWNDAFIQYFDIALAGCRAGFHIDGVTSKAGATAIPVTSNGSHNSTTLILDVVAGEYVFASIGGIGECLLQAKVDVHTGASFPITVDGDGHNNLTPGGDSNWSVIATNDQVTYCRHRYQAHMTDRCATIWAEEFAAVGRAADFTGILCNNVQNSISTYVSTMLTWNTMNSAGSPDGEQLMDKVGYFGIAPYWGKNLLNYTSADITGWTTTEKNLVGSDVPAFVTAYCNAAYGVIDTLIDGSVVPLKVSLAAFLVQHGRSPDQTQLCSYEANHNMIAWNWSGSLATAMNTNFATIQRAPEFGAVCSYYAQSLATKVGGLHMIFDRIGGEPATGADATSVGSAMTNWGLTEGEMDVATSGTSENYRYAAFANAKDGIFS